jgi:hypothetical protein
MSTPRKIVFILVLSILFLSPLPTGSNARAAIGKWEVFELPLTTSNSHSNPYTEVTLSATFTAPSSNTIEVPGFWDGGQTWKVRMAPNEIGTWTYSTTSNDNQLDGNTGQFECVASGKKGFIKVNPSDHYKFQYDDGTPFFWMGDTCWHLFSDHIDYDTEFKDYIDRRASQHFNNIHAVLDVKCQLYGHEVGEPFLEAHTDWQNWINPDYFKNVDRKMDYMASKDMAVGLFLTWAQRFIQFTRAQFERYEKYAIARYAAYNVYWVISGEFEEESTPSEYAYHGQVIDAVDPYDHPISTHTLDSCNEFGNDSWLTYVMHQNGEQDSTILLSDLLIQLNRTDITPIYNRPVNVADGDSLYTDVQADRTYNKPVVNGEFGYEAYEGWNDRTGRTTPDTVRKLAWNLVMAGGFFTYGMDATYKAFDNGGKVNWHLPENELGGSDSMKLLYEFMTGTKWWEMHPDNSVITSGSAVALVNPGIEYVVYLRSGSSVSVNVSAASGDLNVQWFDTKDGDRVSQGTVPGGGVRVFSKPAGIDGEGVLRLYGPVDSVISGLGETSDGWSEAFAGDFSHADWLRANWGAYNAANGEVRVAVGDIDGDGRDEIVLGLGPVVGDPSIPGGWFEVLDDDYTHLAWGRVKWGAYNSVNGESWPACGDVDGDGQDEIIIGLGSYPGAGGYVEVFDFTGGSVVHTAWVRVKWGGYNSANGETRPACGDIDGDNKDEIVVGLGQGGLGYLEVFDDALAGHVHMAWPQVKWGSYNSASGETRPACGDIDGDGRDEIVIGLGSVGSGWMEVFDDAEAGYLHLGWPRIHWDAYTTANGETWPAIKN